jgi:hypothetical protein
VAPSGSRILLKKNEQEIQGMKIFRYAVAALVMSCMMASASDKFVTMTGWVHDSACAAKGLKAEAGCVRKCIAGGQKLVFVDDAEKKVYEVANPKELMNYAGEHIQLKSTLNKDGALKVKDAMGVMDSPSSQASSTQH